MYQCLIAALEIGDDTQSCPEVLTLNHRFMCTAFFLLRNEKYRMMTHYICKVTISPIVKNNVSQASDSLR